MFFKPCIVVRYIQGVVKQNGPKRKLILPDLPLLYHIKTHKLLHKMAILTNNKSVSVSVSTMNHFTSNHYEWLYISMTKLCSNFEKV